ncbi:MAG: hypothetical protein EBT96_00735 [Betaproteobacteria bacterium]|nr:hypothetical protein [Betaproteobacteria bacterium]
MVFCQGTRACGVEASRRIERLLRHRARQQFKAGHPKFEHMVQVARHPADQGLLRQCMHLRSNKHQPRYKQGQHAQPKQPFKEAAEAHLICG